MCISREVADFLVEVLVATLGSMGSPTYMLRIKLIAGLAVHMTILGCTPAQDPARSVVTVLAAASLNDVVDELADVFEKTHSASLTISSGASGALCAQIEFGAPCDVFLSADPALVDRLDTAGRVVSDSRCVLAQNRLVIAVAASNATGGKWSDAQALEGVSRIAFADPDSAPAGRYAREALVKSNLWDRVRTKLVHAGDVRSAARLLAMRTVDAAIVYETDVAATRGIATVYVFAAGMHTPIEYVGAIVESRDMRSKTHDTAVAGFLEFLRSDMAQAIWHKHGFAVTPTHAETESS